MLSSIDLSNINYKFLFDNSFQVAKAYEAIMEEKMNDSLYKILSHNMVKKNATILISMSKKDGVDIGNNVEFDRSSGYYKATTCGYVGYKDNAIHVFPILNISEKWRGVIILAPQKGVSSPIGIDELQSIISELNIKVNVDYNSLNDAIASSLEDDKGYMGTFVEGKKVINGKVAKVIVDYDFTIDVGLETSSGKIDFKERGFINNVYQGLVVAHYDPESPKIDGLDIHDAIIFATFDSDPCYKLGENIAVDEDEVSIIAASKGVISITNNVINVKDLIELESIDLSTGNIKSSSSVVVKNNIEPGFDVEVEGDLIVYGNIEDAKIKVNGNLIVSGGITGGMYGDVYVEGNIYSAFFNNANVVATNDIIVNQVINSKVLSNNRIIALHGKATIIGGNVTAKNEIYARVIGSSSGTTTIVTVGRDVEASKKLSNLLDRLKYCKDEINKIKSMLGSEYFKNSRAFLARISPDRKVLIKEKLKDMAAFTAEIEENEKDRKEILLNSNNIENCKISILDKIYSGSILYLTSAKKEVVAKSTGTELYYHSDCAAIRERMPSILKESEYNLSKKK